MDKEDARHQTLVQLYERRKQVIRLHLKGYGVMRIVELCGLSYPTVRGVIDRYVAGGAASIKPAARGKQAGNGRVLSEQQEQAIRQIICEKRPEQLKMDFALWTRGAVTELIERECGIAISVRGTGTYLKRWGFTPQKPIKRAYEQRPEAVQKWLNEEYPAIALRARAENGEIQWGDETALVNTDVRGRSYAPSGKTPVTLAVGGTRQKLSMIATVTNRGQARWMIIEEAFNADKLITFLGALIKGSRKKVFLILDNLRVHRSKQVKEWVEPRGKKIELFYLPSYSPELNPEERLNADLKHAICTKVPVRTKAKLKEAATNHMTLLEKSPRRVKKYFQDPYIKYAA
ncbi:MAG: IS630 family transposase [Collimonas sp.]